jgi:SPP1 gp7 family putative phage head morphogenesis protein
MVEGQTTDQIVRRIRGTRARQYQDGILDISRRETQAVVRTAVAQVSDRAANSVWQENKDIIKGLKWVSTLDGRTSAICRERDGKIYTVDTVPPVPAHFNCRSRTIPYLGEFKTKGTRASSGGAVPEDVSYGDWLRRQPKEVQEEVLGVKKAKLFREGGLPIDRFQDSTGREYTLDELKKRDSKTWNKVF